MRELPITGDLNELKPGMYRCTLNVTNLPAYITAVPGYMDQQWTTDHHGRVWQRQTAYDDKGKLEWTRLRELVNGTWIDYPDIF
ncbi:hypothetical protein NSS79_20470 [Paenibacillus sp. FSL L8-0436]|uniref:hypothetical protein n=1 Tax=Paenibacillus sp. FSL L8-0436 TaxID=2954686 RepID=UPI0031598884